jgi:hypothetical protein
VYIDWANLTIIPTERLSEISSGLRFSTEDTKWRGHDRGGHWNSESDDFRSGNGAAWTDHLSRVGDGQLFRCVTRGIW